MKRAYYSSTIEDFINEDPHSIFGKIISNDLFASEDLQKNTWRSEIEILKRELRELNEGQVLFEYTIPRIGKRIDNVILYELYSYWNLKLGLVTILIMPKNRLLITL